MRIPPLQQPAQQVGPLARVRGGEAPGDGHDGDPGERLHVRGAAPVPRDETPQEGAPRRGEDPGGEGVLAAPVEDFYGGDGARGAGVCGGGGGREGGGVCGDVCEVLGGVKHAEGLAKRKVAHDVKREVVRPYPRPPSTTAITHTPKKETHTRQTIQPHPPITRPPPLALTPPHSLTPALPSAQPTQQPIPPRQQLPHIKAHMRLERANAPRRKHGCHHPALARMLRRCARVEHAAADGHERVVERGLGGRRAGGGRVDRGERVRVRDGDVVRGDAHEGACGAVERGEGAEGRGGRETYRV